MQSVLQTVSGVWNRAVEFTAEMVVKWCAYEGVEHKNEFKCVRKWSDKGMAQRPNTLQPSGFTHISVLAAEIMVVKRRSAIGHFLVQPINETVVPFRV